MGSEPSKRQKAVLDCIRKCIEERGYAPTVRDICKELGLSSPSTVHVHLKALEDKGLIKRDAHKSRSIILVDQEGEASEPEVEQASRAQMFSNVLTPSFARTVEVPLVGNVAAGVPILAEQNIEDTMSLPTDIVGDAASFMLSVRGDSMVECGINDGDYVVVKEQPNANNGDIVVAIIDDGATVKRYFREADHIRLQPENSSMEPIITRDCSIAGKVVAVFRRL
ncbi:MAG: transcriptional repressor LexA [Coriobacteriia bacterium]|nr:transcriptional repressor LexA [Coriobacteriia bacterium]